METRRAMSPSHGCAWNRAGTASIDMNQRTKAIGATRKGNLTLRSAMSPASTVAASIANHPPRIQGKNPRYWPGSEPARRPRLWLREQAKPGHGEEEGVEGRDEEDALPAERLPPQRHQPTHGADDEQ